MLVAMINKVRVIHEGEDYILITYKQDGKNEEAEITGFGRFVIKDLTAEVRKLEDKIEQLNRRISWQR